MDKLKYKKVNHPEIAIQSGLSGLLRTVDIDGNADNAFIPFCLLYTSDAADD